MRQIRLKKPMPSKLKQMLIRRAKISKKASNKIKKALDVIKNNYDSEVQKDGLFIVKILSN